jgi:hypothetical protein
VIVFAISTYQKIEENLILSSRVIKNIFPLKNRISTMMFNKLYVKKHA